VTNWDHPIGLYERRPNGRSFWISVVYVYAYQMFVKDLTIRKTLIQQLHGNNIRLHNIGFCALTSL